MLYVGLDVHSKSVAVCVLNEKGELVERQRLRHLQQLPDLLVRMPPFAVCYEASCGYGCVYEMLKSLAARIAVAHPGLLRLIYRSKRKHDRLDAEKLARLLLLDAVPEVHVPSGDVRSWRELITFRRKLVEKRTRAKNGVRTLLRSLGIRPPQRPRLWTKQGLAWLRDLELSQPLQAVKRDQLVEEIETLTAQVRRVERALKQYAQDNVAVCQLQSIPGVGLRTAEAMVAFVDDPHRFRNAKAVGAYFGLVPSQDQSGESNRLGRITRQGAATVRHLLVEAAWQAARRSPTVRAYFERIRRGDPERNKIALVATAHYLARVMWAMLKDGSLWQERVEPKAA